MSCRILQNSGHLLISFNHTPIPLTPTANHFPFQLDSGDTSLRPNIFPEFPFPHRSTLNDPFYFTFRLIISSLTLYSLPNVWLIFPSYNKSKIHRQVGQ